MHREHHSRSARRWLRRIATLLAVGGVATLAFLLLQFSQEVQQVSQGQDPSRLYVMPDGKTVELPPGVSFGAKPQD